MPKVFDAYQILKFAASNDDGVGKKIAAKSFLAPLRTEAYL